MRHNKIRGIIINNEQTYASSIWWKREMYDKQFDQSPFGVYGSNKYNVEGLEEMQKLSYKFWRPAETPTSKELGSAIGDVCPIPNPNSWNYSPPLDHSQTFHKFNKCNSRQRWQFQDATDLASSSSQNWNLFEAVRPDIPKHRGHFFLDFWASMDDTWEGRPIFWYIQSILWIPSGDYFWGSYRIIWSWDYYDNVSSDKIQPAFWDTRMQS